VGRTCNIKQRRASCITVVSFCDAKALGECMLGGGCGLVWV
jgi:hypothetical protein